KARRDREGQELGRRGLHLLAELDRNLAIGLTDLALQFAGELRFPVAHCRAGLTAALIDAQSLGRRAPRFEDIRNRCFRCDRKNADGGRSVIGNLVSLGKLDWIRTVHIEQEDAKQVGEKDAAKQKEQKLSREASREEPHGFTPRTSAAKTRSEERRVGKRAR